MEQEEKDPAKISEMISLNWHGNWSNLKWQLQSLFHDYSSFPEVLIFIILNYCESVQWGLTASSSWPQEAYPGGILTYKQHIYLCKYSRAHLVTMYNKNGTSLKEIPNVVTVHDLHIWSLSVDSPALAVHLVIEPSQDNPNNNNLQHNNQNNINNLVKK